MRLGFLATRRRIVGTVATIATLATVIFIAAALSGQSRSPRPVAEETPPAIQAEQLAQRAEEAVSQADTTTAGDLARQALRLDPANSSARRVLDRISTSSPDDGGSDVTDPGDSSSDPGSNGSKPKPSPVTTGAVPAGIYAKPVGKVSALLPATFKDWSAGTPVADSGQAVVTYEPRPGSTDARKSVRAAVYAIDSGSSSAASRYLTTVNARAYTADGATVPVGIVPTARFATDGSRSAVVAFARGRYAFEVILTVQPGVDPATMKAVAVAIASGLPATR